MTINRPFDLLKDNNGKEVEVTLKNQEVYVGILDSYDIHLNLVLKETKNISSDKNESVGDILIRGDAIVTIKILK